MSHTGVGTTVQKLLIIKMIIKMNGEWLGEYSINYSEISSTLDY